MPEHGLEDVCAEVTGLDLGDFFDASIRGTGELPLRRLLAKFGVEYHLRAASSSKDRGGKASAKDPGPWLGATLSDNVGKSVFTVVANGGPAEHAGVAPGDVAVALDGVALTAANCDQRLTTYRHGDRLELVVFRGDELLTTKVRLEQPPETTCFLRLDKEADAEALGRQAAWLETGSA